MSIKLFFYRLLKIRQSEEKKLVEFSLAYFFLSMATGFLANVVDSIFLGGASTDLLNFSYFQPSELVPLLLVVNSILLIIVSLVYSYYTDRFDKRISLIVLVMISGAITGGFWIFTVIFRNDSLFILSLLYLFRLMFTILLVLQFWEMANSYFDLREGKRLFPIILIIGTIGYSTASFVIALTTQLFGAYNNLLLIVICFVLAIFFLNRADVFTPLTPRESKKDILTEAKNIFGILKQNTFVRVFTISTFIFGIAAGLILYAYNDIVNDLGIKRDTLVIYMGVWRGSANLIISLAESFIRVIEAAIIIQILSNASMGKNFFFTFIIKVFGFILLLLFFVFSMVATADLSRQLLQALVSPASVIAFSILPRQVKGKIMNINNGLISQLGILIAGAVLQFLNYLRPVYILGVIMGLIAIRIILNFVINRAYLNTLSSNIQSVNLADISSNIGNIIKDKALFDNLLEQYEKQELSVKIFILNMIRTNITDEKYAIDNLNSLLDREKEPKIKVTIIKMFYEISKINISDKVKNYLDYDKPKLAKISTLYLFRYGDKETVTQLQEELLHYLRSENLSKYKFALSVIEDIDKNYKDYFLEDILEQVKESSDKVKKLSIPALININNKSADEYIIKLIKENDYVRKEALKIIPKEGNRFIYGLRDCYQYFEEQNRIDLLFKIISSIGKINSLKSVEFLRNEFIKKSSKLLEVFSENEPYKEHYELQYLKAILNASVRNNLANFNSIRDLSIKVVKVFLERSYSFILLSQSANAYIRDDNLRVLFKKICNEELEEYSYISAKIYALINPQELKKQSMLESINRFSTKNPLIKAQAFEAFENFARNKYANVITILLDYKISDYDRINSLNKYLKKRKIDFNEVMNYWLSLEGKEFKTYLYKHLIAKKIIRV